MPKRASKRASKRRKSKQIKKRRNTNKKRFFGGELNYSLTHSTLSPLYSDLDNKGIDNPEVNRRNSRFFNVYANYAAGIKLFTWLSERMKGKLLSDEQILEKRLAEKIVGLDSFDDKLIRLLKQKDEIVSVNNIKNEIDQYFNLDTVLFSVLKAKFIEENKPKQSVDIGSQQEYGVSYNPDGSTNYKEET